MQESFSIDPKLIERTKKNIDREIYYFSGMIIVLIIVAVAVSRSTFPFVPLAQFTCISTSVFAVAIYFIKKRKNSNTIELMEKHKLEINDNVMTFHYLFGTSEFLINKIKKVIYKRKKSTYEIKIVFFDGSKIELGSYENMQKLFDCISAIVQKELIEKDKWYLPSEFKP